MPPIIFRFLLCGSSDNDAYIWRTDECSSLPWVLKGHESEVTSVAWAPFDGEKVGKEKMEAFNRVDDTLNLSVALNTKIIYPKTVGGKVSIVHVSTLLFLK